MSLLIGTIRKDAKKIRHGSTEIKSVWWGAIKVWPMAKLYFLNTGDETIEWSITNESAALHAATSTTQIRLRASKSDIKLPFSYQCSENIRIKSISAVTTGHTVTLSSTEWGATGHITLGNNNYFSSDAVTNPDFIITWEVKANTTLQNRVSTIKFYDLMDIIDNPSNPENCDVDPCTFTLTQRPDTVLWDSASIVYYTSNACTEKANGYTLNQYTSGTVPLYFRVEAKRESGLTYYYGQGVFGDEGAGDLTVSRATTSVATAATTPSLDNSTTYCWKTTVSISTNEGCWGQWSQGSIAYNTNAVYTANATQTLSSITHPKRNWIGTTSKSSNVTVTMKHNDEQADRGVVTATITGTTKITQNADNRTSSEEDNVVAYYVVGGSTDVQSYNIVKYQTVTVSCTQGATATIKYSTAGLSGTLYAEFIMDPTYYGGGHLTQQIDTTTTANNANLSKTFTARSTGTATVYVIIRQNTKRAMASTVAISTGKAGNLSVDENGKLTWSSSNGDAIQVAWTNPADPLTLTHTTCAYGPASGYDYANQKSSGKCTTSVTVESETIYMRYVLKTAGNAISVAETTDADSGKGTNGSRTFNLTWKSNLGSWAAWPACTNAIYNISYNNAPYTANATQSVIMSTPKREWNTTKQKSCVVTCYARCGNDAPTRSMTITAYWAKSNEEAQTTATQNGTVQITASKDITCYQNADNQTNAQANAAGRGAYQATPSFSISGNAAASIDASTGKVTWSTANGDGTQVEFTEGVSWSNVSTASKAANATSSGKATAKVNVATEPVYIYFKITDTGNASSCTGTTAASGGNGTGERTTTVTWKSNTGSFNAWTSNLAIADATATFKSGSKSMAKTGDAKRTYNRTSEKTCTVTAYAYAGQDSDKRSATVKVIWTKEGKENYTSSGTAADAITGSTTCEKTATATQNGTEQRHSEKAYIFKQSADTTADQTDTYKYTIDSTEGASMSETQTGISENTSGTVWYKQNGGVDGSNVAYILDKYTGTLAISPDGNTFTTAGGNKDFSVSGLSKTDGSNGEDKPSRSWKITVTGTNSGKTASGTLTQSGLTVAQVTRPTSSVSYTWSKSGTNQASFTLSTTSGSSTKVTIGTNYCTHPTYTDWGAWTQKGTISYPTNADCTKDATQTVSNTLSASRSRELTNTPKDSTQKTMTLKCTATLSNATDSTTSKSDTCTVKQNGEKCRDTELTETKTSVSYSSADTSLATVDDTGKVTWKSANQADNPNAGTITSNGNIASDGTSGTLTVTGMSDASTGASYTVSVSGTGSKSASLSGSTITVSCETNISSAGDWTTSGSLKYGTNAGACKDNTQSPTSKPEVKRTTSNTSDRTFTVTLKGTRPKSSRGVKITATVTGTTVSTSATATQNGCAGSSKQTGTITQNKGTQYSGTATVTYSTSDTKCTVDSSTGKVTWGSDNGTSVRSATISWSGGDQGDTATAKQNANSWTASGLS